MNRVALRPLHTPRTAFTLVEVVVSIALLAILLVGIVQATGAHRRTMQQAENRLAAVAIADELLERLAGRDGRYVLDTGGPIPSRPGWTWALVPTGTQSLAGQVVDTFRLVVAGRSRQPLVQIDLVQDRGVGRP